MQKIITNLWFDSEAEQAAHFYTSIFPNSWIGDIMRFAKAGREIHGREPGSVSTVEFELDGNSFIGLNGGPIFKFNEAISLFVTCKDQSEVDYYWNRLGEGGDPAARQCGWLKDKFGLSWQIVPAELKELLSDPARAERVTAAFMQMKKLDIETLKSA